jgi:hypothetical protein
MIDLKFVRDRADEVLEGPPVREHHLAAAATNAELDIPRAWIDMRSPKPATIRRAAVDAGEESGLVVAVDALLNERVSMVVPPLVVRVAPASGADGQRTSVHAAPVARHIESVSAAEARARIDVVHTHMLQVAAAKS